MALAGVARPAERARAMYAALGASALELLWLARRGDEAVGRVVVDPASAEALAAARAEGRGVVLAASHTGNWDLAACGMAREGELLVVTKRLSLRSVDAFWQSTRAARGVQLTGARGALGRAREVLGRGGAVAMMIDQVPEGRHAVPVEFLGRAALADRAPAVLAAASGAPLVVSAARRDGRGGHVLHVLAVLRPPPRGALEAQQTRAWVGQATASATRALEGFVLAHPEEWLWLHRRWKGATLAAPWPRDPLVIAGRSFESRLIVGTGKYKDAAETERAIEASGAEIVTVALRRVDLKDRSSGSLMGLLARKPWLVLPNTAGCYTADEAVRTLRLARELGIAPPPTPAHSGPMVKLEVIGDPQTLYPDNEQTLAAAKILVSEGFVVLPYCMDDPILCKKLEDAGCAAVMPLAAPIGSGLGIRNPHNLEIILERARVPVIVDAGVGTASDAAVAMELGCHGVLMNTAIAHAKDPVLMAEAMREGIRAGRKAYLAGRMPRRRYANASSPTAGLVTAGGRPGALAIE